MISDELILAGKLQLKKLQKKKPEKKFRLRRGLNPCLPDTSWALYQLSYEATCWERGKFFQASFSAISLIAVYLRGSIRHKTNFSRNTTQTAVINIFKIRILLNLTFRMFVHIRFQKYNRYGFWEANFLMGVTKCL